MDDEKWILEAAEKWFNIPQSQWDSPDVERGGIEEFLSVIRSAHAQSECGKRIAELEAALKALCDKLDQIAQDETFKSVFTLAMVHGMTYKGPYWNSELEQARKVLEGK